MQTDRKAAHRRRTKAGFVYLGKFIRKGDIPSVQDKLLTAEQVDAEIDRDNQPHSPAPTAVVECRDK